MNKNKKTIKELLIAKFNLLNKDEQTKVLKEINKIKD